MTTQTRRDRRPTVEARRRPRGTGTIRQRGNTFTACWFTIDPATGKRQRQSRGGFTSDAEAQRHVTTVLAQVQRGTFPRDRTETSSGPWTAVETISDQEGVSPSSVLASATGFSFVGGAWLRDGPPK